MAKQSRPSVPPPRADLSALNIRAAIKKLERRQNELNERSRAPYDPRRDGGDAKILANSVNATIDEIFGVGTADAKDFEIRQSSFWSSRIDASLQEQVGAFHNGIVKAKKIVDAAIARLKEKEIDGALAEPIDKTVQAYEGLELHPDIARAASDLYLDGHYSNAIEDAVKALNALVRLRSGCDDKDGIQLMEFVFSLNNPILQFNELKDQSDRDEQKGFMMMFSGAVAGLRNPRAHRLIQDDPERALEFIAFVSLLAKLLDGANRARSHRSDLR